MSSLVSDRLGRRIILLLLIIKMVVTGFNFAEQSVRSGYDYRHHAWRARSAGLEMGKMAYNPPLYYFPALPSVDVGAYYHDGKPIITSYPYDTSETAVALLDRIRLFNFGYLLSFYVAWIYFIFPHVVPNRRSWLLASLLLLTLPGYQKAAAMAHPDNLLMSFSACTTALWIRLHMLQRARFRDGIGLAFATGLVGLTRPFAIVPIFFFSLLNAWSQAKNALADKARPIAKRIAAVAGRLVAIGAIVVALAGSWWTFRYLETGTVFGAYAESYIEHFEPYRKGFDYRHYYTSFHFVDLIINPSRDMSGSDEPSHNLLGNTFPTIVYSEIWGDHWLYYSGTDAPEHKAWAKRIALVTALPLSVAFMGLLAVGLVRAAVRYVRSRCRVTPEALFAAMACVGFGLFIYWQGHSGLLPGKNSTIKFMYFAYAAPYAIATAFGARLRERTFHALAAYTLVVFATTLPIAVADAAWIQSFRLS